MRVDGAARRARGAAVVAGACSAALLLSSCGLTSISLGSHSAAQTPAAHITVTPTLGAAAASPGTPVVVRVADGRLSTVMVKRADGTRLSGKVSQDGRTWVSRDRTLGYGAKYQVAVTAVDREGLTTTTTNEFRTLTPKLTAEAYISPGQGDVVGVGMPIVVQFDHEVRRKALVEKQLEVLTPTPLEGGWYWRDDKMVEYRPKTFWPANTRITVKVPLVGVELAQGVWGDKDRSVTFRTGAAMVSKVDMDAHQLTVIKNGRVLRTIPVTTGKPGFATRTGVKVIMMKERTRIMDAATGGTDAADPEYYRIEVEYAMRLTWSGEFLHAAPWSVGSQGSSNVSHGCTGMSTGNAAWLYSVSRPGDVVVYSGTSNRAMSMDNGYGEWTLSWDDWKKGSALSA